MTAFIYKIYCNFASFISKCCKTAYLQSPSLLLRLTSKSTSSSNCTSLPERICPHFHGCHDAENVLTNTDGKTHTLQSILYKNASKYSHKMAGT